MPKKNFVVILCATLVVVAAMVAHVALKSPLPIIVSGKHNFTIHAGNVLAGNGMTYRVSVTDYHGPWNSPARTVETFVAEMPETTITGESSSAGRWSRVYECTKRPHVDAQCTVTNDFNTGLLLNDLVKEVVKLENNKKSLREYDEWLEESHRLRQDVLQ